LYRIGSLVYNLGSNSELREAPSPRSPRRTGALSLSGTKPKSWTPNNCWGEKRRWMIWPNLCRMIQFIPKREG
ncbi:hypothetical protein FA13DRAFT_1741863, partial [Coprinellus micaceus]